MLRLIISGLAVFVFSYPVLLPRVHAGQGDQAAFFQHRVQHSYNAVFGLPAVAARLVQTREWQLALEHSNQFMGGTTERELLLIDGESSELMLRYRQRLGACTQLDVALPFIQHSEGLFDRAIDDWHQFFGLPDAQRGSSPFFELNYSYVDENGQQTNVQSAQSGLGDIQLAVQRSLKCTSAATATASKSMARIGIKLPTGKLNELTGSGEFDIYADIQSPVWTNSGRWRSGLAAGALVAGQSSRLPSQRSLIAYGSAGTQFIVNNRWRLLAQLDWHTPFYDSDLRELGLTAISLSVGIRFLAPANQTFELSISEDAAIDTTPDIVARLAWTYRPLSGR